MLNKWTVTDLVQYLSLKMFYIYIAEKYEHVPNVKFVRAPDYFLDIFKDLRIWGLQCLSRELNVI